MINKNNDDLLMQGFYARRDVQNKDPFNFDIISMIREFDYDDFIYNAKNNSENGSFLVITNNQYIIGYNASFGVGDHHPAFARVMKDINGGGVIRDKNHASQLATDCKKEYLCARLVYEYLHDNEHGIPQYGGFIHFTLPRENYKITPMQFENFKLFYDKYNNDIKYSISKIGKSRLYIYFTYYDQDNKLKRSDDYSDLDALYEFLSNNIDETKEISNENIIIGNNVIKKR